jgi:hypothetical protein
MASSDDRAHAERLLYEHRRRLKALELRKVRAGDSADPSLDTQIEDERRDVSVLEALLETPVSDDVRDTIRRNTEGDFDFTMLFLQGVRQNERITGMEAEMTQVKEKVETVVQAQNAAQLWRLDIADRLESSDIARIYGQRRNFRISLGNIALIMFVLLLVIILFLRAGLL